MKFSPNLRRFLTIPRPENTLKKEQRDKRIAAQTVKDAQDRKKHMATNRKEYLERAKKYQAEYIKADRDLINQKRQARAEGNIFVEAQPKVALVIRIKG